jgi:NAD(P) transhydrogenase subunit alpha
MMEFWTAVYVFMLASFVGLGVIRRVSRLLHTPLMSITNTTSAVAVVGSVLVAGGDYPSQIRTLGAIAICASTSHIVSGLLSRYRMPKLFKASELRQRVRIRRHVAGAMWSHEPEEANIALPGESS